MTKGEETKQRIIEQAAVLFNQHGYSGSSINDVMTITGLQKGGIYRHFGSKEELALAAFDYAAEQSTGRLEHAVTSEPEAVDQLLAFVRSFESRALRPAMPGGCPIFNTLIDSDDGDPALRAHALAVVTCWEEMIGRSIAHGVKDGTIKPHTDPQAVATMLIGTLEGAIVLSRVHASTVYMQNAAKLLVDYIKREVAI